MASGHGGTTSGRAACHASDGAGCNSDSAQPSARQSVKLRKSTYEYRRSVRRRQPCRRTECAAKPHTTPPSRRTPRTRAACRAATGGEERRRVGVAPVVVGRFWVGVQGHLGHLERRVHHPRDANCARAARCAALQTVVTATV